MDAETRYRLLGRLIQEMPEIPVTGPVPPPVLEWLGRADALVTMCTNSVSVIDWRMAQTGFEVNRAKGIEAIQLFLYRVLAAQELIAPPSIRGAFVPVGSPYDAFAAL